MPEPTLPAGDSFLLSPRTASYIVALIREGDKFDYSKWLRRVREGEAQAKQGPTTFISEGLVAAEIGDQTAKSDGIWPNPKLTNRTMSSSKPLRLLHRAPKSKAPPIRIRRRLEKVRCAWDTFQETRDRDAVYDYLEAVFAVVIHYKVRRKTKKLLRHAFKFAGLPIDKNADPFTAVIRCTSGDDVDSKAISKWARALRYFARCKAPGTRVKTSMKRVGAVNACADGYAKQCARMRSGGSRG
jgi:hypothetical protein